MNDQVALIFTTFLYILIICIIINSLLSWFPQVRGTQLDRLLNQVVEPLLQPVRRILPQTGMIDLSGLVVIIVLYVMITATNQWAAQ